MGLIDAVFTADLKQTNALLERLVKVAERLVYEAYGGRYGHMLTPADDVNPAERETVSYASDDETIKTMMKEAAKQFREAKDESEVSYKEGD